MSDEKILKRYVEIAELIAKMFTPVLEVIVHDLRKPESSIIAIYNGQISGRKVGDGSSDLGYRRVKGEVPDVITNYKNESPLGQHLKSSTLTIRNDNGDIIGSFCLNLQIDYFDQVKNTMDMLMSTEEHDYLGHAEDYGFGKTKEQIAKNIKAIILKQGWVNTSLSKSQKIEIIHTLYRQGSFQLRGAVELISEELTISIPTVYRYLKQVKEDYSQ